MVFALAALPVVQHHSPPVRLISRRKLRVIGDEPSIRRVHWIAIESRICSDLFRVTSRRWYHEQISIRADRLHLVGHRRETKLLGVRRKINVLRSSALIRRHVVVCSRIQIASFSAAVCRLYKQMAALTLEPVVPMTIQKLLVHPRFYFVLLF